MEAQRQIDQARDKIVCLITKTPELFLDGVFIIARQQAHYETKKIMHEAKIFIHNVDAKFEPPADTDMSVKIKSMLGTITLLKEGV